MSALTTADATLARDSDIVYHTQVLDKRLGANYQQLLRLGKAVLPMKEKR